LDKTSTLLIPKRLPSDSKWMEIYPSLGTGKICYSIMSSNSNPFLLSAGLDGAVIKSTDGAMNWNYTSLNYNSINFTSLVCNPLQQDQIFAGGKHNNNFSALSKSNNNSADCEPLTPLVNEWCGANCIINGINTMAGFVENNKIVIYIGTDGDGLFKYSEDITSTNDNKINKAENFYLSQNYPNPFSAGGRSASIGNPVTIINYQLPMISSGNLKVYDALGREVKTLVNAQQNAGTHSISFDATKLASGIYFYQLKAGNIISTKNIVYLK